jgi:DNA modification methylase
VTTWEVITGDCLEVLKGMEGGSVDAVVTDPPYCSGGYMEAQKNTRAQGLRGATVSADQFKWFAGDNMSTSGLVWLLRTLMVECRRILRPDRSVFMCCDWRMVPHIVPVIEAAGWGYRNMIVWNKRWGGLGVGFKAAHELILEFTNGRTPYWANDGANVIDAARVSAKAKLHGAQKPEGVMAELLRVGTPPGGTVLDPFAGSGTTGVAAVQTGRKFIGVELDPTYADIARRRITEASATLYAGAVA